MNWLTFSNSQLIFAFDRAVQTERKITAQILEMIAEIDRRKIYLDECYSSLHAYLTKRFGYSDSAANRRIDGARLLREIPEVKEKVANGDLNLTQLSKVRTATKGKPVDKKKILDQITKMSGRETDLLIARELDQTVPKFEKSSIHKDESVTLTITLTKEQMELLKQAKDLISHATENSSWAEAVTYLAKKEIKRRKPKPEPCCQYKDPKSGRICGTTAFLQIEHMKPRWAGGTDDPENLTTLCAAHNRHKYRKQAGISTSVAEVHGKFHPQVSL